MHRNPSHSPRQPQLGQALVETALALTVFLLLVMGIFDFGRAIFAYNSLSNAAREAARVGAVSGGTVTDICRTAVTKSFVPGAPNPAGCPGSEGGWSPDSADLSVTIIRGVAGDTSQPVQVTLTYQFHAVTPLIGLIIGDPLTLTAASKMYVEK